MFFRKLARPRLALVYGPSFARWWYCSKHDSPPGSSGTAHSTSGAPSSPSHCAQQLSTGDRPQTEHSNPPNAPDAPAAASRSAATRSIRQASPWRAEPRVGVGTLAAVPPDSLAGKFASTKASSVFERGSASEGLVEAPSFASPWVRAWASDRISFTACSSFGESPPESDEFDCDPGPPPPPPPRREP